MIEVIGDLSKQDKQVLKHQAETHSRILEVGVGGSTQILTHYTKGAVTAYDTSHEWIDRTKYNFDKVGVEGKCTFKILGYNMNIHGRYDFAFIDSARETRLPAAFKAWALLIPGGSVAFHDTRRDRDFDNLLRFIGKMFREVEKVECNVNDSNISIVTKRHKRADYVNWHKVEKMTKEQLGIEWLERK